MRYEMEKLYLSNSKLTVTTPGQEETDKASTDVSRGTIWTYGLTAVVVLSTAAYTWSVLRPKVTGID